MFQHATLGDTVYVHFAANNVAGSGSDGATPTATIRLCGAAASAAPLTYVPTSVLLSHASYPPGAHEIAIAATTANGFAAGSTYAVFCTLAVDGQTPTGYVGSIILAAIPVTLTQTAAEVASIMAGSTLTIQRGDTLSASFTGLGNISARTKLWITGKRDRAHADALAEFKIEETAGLEYIAGVAATTNAANGSITVTDAVTGALTVALAAVETAKLSEMIGGAYDIQMLSASGVSTLTDATLVVTQDVTRAVA